jgi:hypothetical protein
VSEDELPLSDGGVVPIFVYLKLIGDSSTTSGTSEIMDKPVYLLAVSLNVLLLINPPSITSLFCTLSVD